jgi:hypothetical protein
MAYATTNPPRMWGGDPGNRLWYYSSVDIIGDVDAAGYFTNGSALGMKVGDIVLVRDTTTPSMAIAAVSAVTAGGAATVVQQPLA